MSFVGPRPEVPGFADLLTGEDALILTIRPGITGSRDASISATRKSCSGRPTTRRPTTPPSCFRRRSG